MKVLVRPAEDGDRLHVGEQPHAGEYAVLPHADHEMKWPPRVAQSAHRVIRLEHVPHKLAALVDVGTWEIARNEFVRIRAWEHVLERFVVQVGREKGVRAGRDRGLFGLILLGLLQDRGSLRQRRPGVQQHKEEQASAREQPPTAAAVSGNSSTWHPRTPPVGSCKAESKLLRAGDFVQLSGCAFQDDSALHQNIASVGPLAVLPPVLPLSRSAGNRL